MFLGVNTWLPLSLQVTNLEEGLEYEFRVTAENMAGVGKYSKVSESCIARDAVDAPRNLEVVGVTRKSVHLQWQKPEYDGGARITGKLAYTRPIFYYYIVCTKYIYNEIAFVGYIIEKLELPNGRWLKCNFSNVADTNFNIESLTENMKYEFRVFAKNAAGATSLPAKTLMPVC